MKPVLKVPWARADIAEIWHFKAADSLAAANRWFDCIDAKIESLGEFPDSGTPRPEMGEGIRSVPSYPYLIFYRVLPDRVEVLRVVHGAREMSDEIRDSLQ